MDNKLPNDTSPGEGVKDDAYALLNPNPSRVPGIVPFPQDVFSTILATAEMASPGISHRITTRVYISVVNAAIISLS